MLELFPSVQLIRASALFAVGGWLLGAIIWVMVGKIETLSRKINARQDSAGQGNAPLVCLTGRKSSSRREAEGGRLVSVGHASSALFECRARQIANDQFVSDIK